MIFFTCFPVVKYIAHPGYEFSQQDIVTDEKSAEKIRYPHLFFLNMQRFFSLATGTTCTFDTVSGKHLEYQPMKMREKHQEP